MRPRSASRPAVYRSAIVRSSVASASPGTGSSSPLWKQVRSPVWHAGPAGSTSARIASSSQSKRSSLSRWTFPEVAPLCQSSSRERDQNQSSPVARVRSSASSFMYASVSTSPVRASWTMQGNRSTTRLWTAADRDLQELVSRTDLVEAETAVELLWPVGRVGDHEDRLAALLRGGVGRRGHGSARVAAPAPGLDGPDLVHLCDPVVHVEPARAGGVVRRRREVARGEDAVVARVHLGELAHRLALPPERLLAPERLERRGSHRARDLATGARLGAALRRPPAQHDEHPEDVPACLGELAPEPGAELLVVDHELSVPERALHRVGLGHQVARIGARVLDADRVDLPHEREARREERGAVGGRRHLVADALLRVPEEPVDPLDHSIPRRSSRPSSRRHPLRTRTFSSRCTRRSSRRSISLRAAVPTARTIRPPAPTRMPFCDSVSAHTRARTTRRPSARSSISPISTSTACGSSSRVRSSTCSRISSASWSSSDWSECSSGGYMNGPSGTSETSCSTTGSTPPPSIALIGNSSPCTSNAAA